LSKRPVFRFHEEPEQSTGPRVEPHSQDGSWNNLLLRRVSLALMSRRIVSMFMFAHQATTLPSRAMAKAWISSRSISRAVPALIVLEATGGFEITVPPP